MQRGLITAIWLQQFGSLPNENCLSLFTVTFAGDDDERRFSWLLMKSSTQQFRTENERAEWIAAQTWEAAIEGDGVLPSWK